MSTDDPNAGPDPIGSSPNAVDPNAAAPDPNVASQDASKVDDIKAQAQALVESVKQEIAARLDQLLDQLGALI